MGEVAGLPVVVFVIVLVLSIMAIVGAILGGTVIALRRQVQRTREQWAEGGVVIRKGPELANYRGHASVAVPVRGNGALALTDRDLRFAQLIPRREFVIPLAQITRVERQRVWHGSYHAGRPVIVAYYRDGAQEDAIGLSARRTQDWLEAIANAAGVPVKQP
jgi:hypothetical protein